MKDRAISEKRRREKLKDLILRLHEGESEEEIKEEFSEHFQTVSPLEISVMERRLMKEEGLSAQEIMRLCNVHVAVMAEYVDIELPHDFMKPGHPAHMLKEENFALEAALIRIRNLLEVYVEAEGKDEEIRQGLAQQIELIWEFDKHYDWKENSIFPIMEREGNTAPPAVMWGVDDEIRDLYRAFKAVFEDNALDKLLPVFSEFEYELQEMFVKEENILIPMITETFTDEDWIKIAQEKESFGYCIVKPLAKWPSEEDLVDKNEPENLNLTDEIPIGTGSLTLKELDLMLDALPLELTFVDKHHVMKYYNNDKVEKIQPRHPGAIGRDLKLSHPPRVYENVMQLVHDLESGKKDKQISWYQSEGRFIYVTHMAIRDENGEFQGFLEYVQDVTELQGLGGENRDFNS